jgi:hypothetical protein
VVVNRYNVVLPVENQRTLWRRYIPKYGILQEKYFGGKLQWETEYIE